MPPVFVYKQEDIEKSLRIQQSKGWTVFDGQVSYWFCQMKKLNNQGKWADVEHIGCVMLHYLNQYASSNTFEELTDEEFDFEIAYIKERLEIEFGVRNDSELKQ